MALQRDRERFTIDARRVFEREVWQLAIQEATTSRPLGRCNGPQPHYVREAGDVLFLAAYREATLAVDLRETILDEARQCLEQAAGSRNRDHLFWLLETEEGQDTLVAGVASRVLMSLEDIARGYGRRATAARRILARP